MKSWGNLPFHFNCYMRGINYFYISPLEKKSSRAAYLSKGMPAFHSFLFGFFISMSVLIYQKLYLKITQVTFIMQVFNKQVLKLYGKCLVLHSTSVLLGAHIVLSNYSWHFTYPTVSVFRGDRQKASALALRFPSNCAPCQRVQRDARNNNSKKI